MTSRGSAAFSRVMSDEAIMAVVCARADAAVFSELVARWQQQVQSLCLRLTGNLHDAEDAAQETFTRVYTARAQFRGAAKFSTWLWRIAINVTQDMRRRPVPQTELKQFTLLTTGTQSPPEAASAAELGDLVCLALQELPEDLRTVVVLRHYQQMKFREISEVLEIPVGTVCSRMTEGLSRLSLRLRNLETIE